MCDTFEVVLKKMGSRSHFRNGIVISIGGVQCPFAFPMSVCAFAGSSVHHGQSLFGSREGQPLLCLPLATPLRSFVLHSAGIGG